MGFDGRPRDQRETMTVALLHVHTRTHTYPYPYCMHTFPTTNFFNPRAKF